MSGGISRVASTLCVKSSLLRRYRNVTEMSLSLAMGQGSLAETEADDAFSPVRGVVTCLEPHPSANVRRQLRERCLALAGHRGSEEQVSFSCAPYRVCPLGAHIDHQGGTVAGFALNMGICIAYIPSPEDDRGEIKLAATRDGEGEGEPSTFEMHVTDDPEPTDDWTAFVRGVVHVVRGWASEKGARCDAGFTGVISGCPGGLEGGGISSSAALTVALIHAFRDVNNLASLIRREDVVRLAQRVEHEWRGVRCGILDQGCVVMSKPGALTVLDCARYQRRFARADDRTATASSRGDTAGATSGSGSDGDGDEETFSPWNPLRWFGGDWTPSRTGPSRIDPNVDESGREVVKDFWDDGPDAGSDLPFAVILAFSGVRKPLTRTGYNDRVDECQRAARLLLDASGRGVPRDGTPPTLHMVTREEWTAAMRATETTSGPETLPENLARRARHFFEENRRAVNGVRAWRDGDIASFGALVNASGASSVENYECGCEQITALWKIAKDAAGVFGARFSGAGFRGCVVALCEPGRAAMDAAELIAGEYARLYPELAADAPVIVTRPGRGAFILRNEDE